MFEEIKREQEEEARKRHEWGMFILSIMSGPALSWFAGGIQYGLYEKMVTSIGTKAGLLEEAIKVAAHDKVGAKVVGDAGKSVAAFLLDKGVKAVSPASDYQPPDAGGVVNSLTPALFKANLEQALRRQKWLIKSAIAQAALSAKDPSWDVASTVLKQDPWIQTADFVRQELYGQQKINEWLDVLRSQWRQDWFYFGNDPAKLDISGVAQAMEREMWALWVLQKQFLVKFWDQDGEGHGSFAIFDKDGIKDGAVFWLELQPIVRRLRSFGAPVDDFLVPDSVAYAIANKLKGDPPPKYRDYSNNPDMNPSAAADLQRSLDKLLNWASHRPPEVIDLLNKGPNKATLRNLPPVEQIPAYIAREAGGSR